MEGALFLRALMALVFVLGLLMLMAWALRRWGGKLGLTAIPGQDQGKKIRLLEAAMVDSKHRLVIVRVENREHLILLGGSAPVVVESKDVQGNE